MEIARFYENVASPYESKKHATSDNFALASFVHYVSLSVHDLLFAVPQLAYIFLIRKNVYDNVDHTDQYLDANKNNHNELQAFFV